MGLAVFFQFSVLETEVVIFYFILFLSELIVIICLLALGLHHKVARIGSDLHLNEKLVFLR